ncbi:hypothetical protein SS50377_22427 [Spironucleus salmonicida]|uniref:Transmembrane protein n=1 Tax=Spironucleus salmonicida TaxID=348837 RepID=V6LC87_9EUKA|nr:hypothetical protein SS50377_22427 [Spironucleus salmonicida]|eukprot:EST42082.1 Hypothetical protein SS50377_ee007 [Spironucleus salmonicida]
MEVVFFYFQNLQVVDLEIARLVSGIQDKYYQPAYAKFLLYQNIDNQFQFIRLNSGINFTDFYINNISLYSEEILYYKIDCINNINQSIQVYNFLQFLSLNMQNRQILILFGDNLVNLYITGDISVSQIQDERIAALKLIQKSSNVQKLPYLLQYFGNITQTQDHFSDLMSALQLSEFVTDIANYKCNPSKNYPMFWFLLGFFSMTGFSLIMLYLIHKSNNNNFIM